MPSTITALVGVVLPCMQFPVTGARATELTLAIEEQRIRCNPPMEVVEEQVRMKSRDKMQSRARQTQVGRTITRSIMTEVWSKMRSNDTMKKRTKIGRVTISNNDRNKRFPEDSCDIQEAVTRGSY